MTFKHAFLATVLATTTLWAQAQTVSVSGPAAPVTVGDTFTLDVFGAGFTDKIYGGGYDISFDASKLSLLGSASPAFWELGASIDTDNTLGTATVNFNTLSPRNGDFLTATLTFKAIGAGPVTISLTESPFFPYGNEVFEPVPVNFTSTSFNVAAVPEPESVLMVLAGLGVFAALRQRRHRG